MIIILHYWKDSLAEWSEAPDAVQSEEGGGERVEGFETRRRKSGNVGSDRNGRFFKASNNAALSSAVLCRSI